ncbi:UrcA family protein [Sphingomonas sp. PAMC26645]|uniref:UrcA family protein n=1 Tax=Sphingomonas sp. PAMC26645 TaxID=2565555 RepID=UPI0014486795|nr:UrcA family protein [Sphingomonas sp. PAMC26645]
MNTNSRRIVCSFLSVVGAASLVAFADPASANSVNVDAPRQTTVKYRDLDLGSRIGRATFDRRVSSAADLVCGVGIRMWSASEYSCRRNVFEQARQATDLDHRTERG